MRAQVFAMFWCRDTDSSFNSLVASVTMLEIEDTVGSTVGSKPKGNESKQQIQNSNQRRNNKPGKGQKHRKNLIIENAQKYN